MDKHKLILVMGDKNFETKGGMLRTEDESEWFYFEPRLGDHTKLYMGAADWPDFGRSLDVKQFTGKNTDKMEVFEAIWSWGQYYGFGNLDPTPTEFNSATELAEWLAEWEIVR